MKKYTVNISDMELYQKMEIRRLISNCNVSFISPDMFVLTDPPQNVIDEIEGYGLIPEIELL